MIIKEKRAIHKKEHIFLKSDSNKYLMYKENLYKEIEATPFNIHKVIETDIDIPAEEGDKE